MTGPACILNYAPDSASPAVRLALEQLGRPRPGPILAPMLRWLAFHPIRSDRDRFDLRRCPARCDAARALEDHPATARAVEAEGHGPAPATAPRLPRPPEGSAT